MFSKAKGALGGALSHGDKGKQGDEEDVSLTTILPTAEDRGALTILIADCTEVMRQRITDVFDAKQTSKKSDLLADLGGDIEPGKINMAEQERLKKELAQREEELSGPKMQELKSDALDYFDDWRTSVIQRVGEIVNSKETAQEQQKHANPRQSKPKTAQAPVRRSVPPAYDPKAEEMMRKLYPPTDNSLKKLPEEKRALILHSVLLLLLSLEHYQAHSRTLLMYLTSSLELSISFLAQDESRVSRGLLIAAENLKADEETKKKAEDNHEYRKWKVGLATVAGAALIGVTGGLAAPLLAAGVGTVMGGLGLGATAAAGYLGTLAGSGVLVGSLFGAYGGRMTGRMMDQYAREVEDFAFLPVRTYHTPRTAEKDYRRLRVAIGVSGWLTNEDDVVEPWRVIGAGIESFALRWELEALMNLGNSMTTMVKSAAWTYAKTEIIKRTVLASLTAGLWPLALLKVSRIIDNPWSVANHRAQKAGEVLADALINKAQGERPVTLIGYSLGAKVIFTCLKRLAERRAFGLIENAVLLGAPTPSTAADWRQIRSIVSGRVVNVYSTQDYILAFLYRSSSIQYGVAGLQAVGNVKGIENTDVSSMVTGHTSYRFLAGTVLRKIGFEDVDAEALQEEQKELKAEETKEERERKEAEMSEQSKTLPVEQMGKTAINETPATAKDTSPVAGTTTLPSRVPVPGQQTKDLGSEIEIKNQQPSICGTGKKMTGARPNRAIMSEEAELQQPGRQGHRENDIAGTAE